MTRLWDEAFWKPAPKPAVAPSPSRQLMVPVSALALLIVAMTFGAEPLFRLTTRAADQLLSPQAYISAVLESGLGR